MKPPSEVQAMPISEASIDETYRAMRARLADVVSDGNDSDCCGTGVMCGLGSMDVFPFMLLGMWVGRVRLASYRRSAR